MGEHRLHVEAGVNGDGFRVPQLRLPVDLGLGSAQVLGGTIGVSGRSVACQGCLLHQVSGAAGLLPGIGGLVSERDQRRRVTEGR